MWLSLLTNLYFILYFSPAVTMNKGTESESLDLQVRICHFSDANNPQQGHGSSTSSPHSLVLTRGRLINTNDRCKRKQEWPKWAPSTPRGRSRYHEASKEVPITDDGIPLQELVAVAIEIRFFDCYRMRFIWLCSCDRHEDDGKRCTIN